MDVELVEEPRRDPIEQASRAGRHELVDWLCLTGLYSLFMLGNILLPSFLWRPRGKFWLESTAFFLDGTLAAEVGILGVWMALSSARWTHRLLGCGVLLGLGASSYLIGLRIADHRLPVGVGLIIHAIALGSWIATWFALALLRARFGWRITSVRTPPDAAIKKQVSIRYLFVITTSIAVLVAMVKAAMPSNSAGTGVPGRILFSSTIFIVYSLLLLVPCCWIGLKKPIPYRLIPALMLEIYLLGSLAIQYLIWNFGLRQGFDWKETAFFFVYSSGFVLSALVAFAVLRRCGFELRTSSQSIPQ